MRGKGVGASLIEGLGEAIVCERGELSARTRGVETTAREAEVVAPPVYDSGRIRAVRRKLALSQRVFAAALNVGDSTVKAWEQGKRVPEGPSLRLLEIAEEYPEAFTAKIRRAG